MDDTQLSVAVWRPTPDRAVEIGMRWYRMRLTGSIGGALRLLFLSLRLSLPDGASLPVLVKHAPVELVANVSATGTLWVIGAPEARKLTAAGVPGYPIVAPARFV